MSFSVSRELRICFWSVKDSELDRKCYAGTSFDTSLEYRKSHAEKCLKLKETWLDIEVAYIALSIKSTLI